MDALLAADGRIEPKPIAQHTMWWTEGLNAFNKTFSFLPLKPRDWRCVQARRELARHQAGIAAAGGTAAAPSARQSAVSMPVWEQAAENRYRWLSP
ncbi:hypothetical protein [Serratia marcescens]|uniref:hypothetical protein n=1 Tax=Serratia marcescens TaxID=615 RepID=UPI000935BF5E|nr:hypothetical protein [Serratia marcescens]